MIDITKEPTDECFGKKPVELTIEEQMAKEKKWSECTGDEIAWLGLDVDMDIKEIADWLEALALSGGCGFGSGDAFGASSNSLATWVSSLADKIRKTDSSRPLRNCDVGTAEEQVQRFKEYCESNMQYYRDMFGTHEGADGWDCREDCPIGKMIDKNDSLCDHCELVWAQMPYEPKGENNAIQ